MSSSTLLLLATAPVVIFVLWHISSTLAPIPVPTSLRNKRIILLIAHPDDESMFFAPTLQALTRPDLGNHLKILCMSTGDADGLGETRRKELEAAAVTLGVRRREDVFVMDDPRFRDGMKNTWDQKEIARVLATAFAPQLIASNGTASTGKDGSVKDKASKTSASSKSKSSSTSLSTTSSTSRSTKFKSKSTTPSSTSTPSSRPSAPVVNAQQTPDGPRASIDVLLTFDPHGISSHPNHISLHAGAHHFLSQLMAQFPGYACPVDLYTLTTINIVRKYSFVLDLIPTYVSGICSSIWDGMTGKNKGASSTKADKGDKVVFVSDIIRYMKARKAMVSGHKSQMVWFRWGWIGLGRYMVINDIRREKVVHA